MAFAQPALRGLPELQELMAQVFRLGKLSSQLPKRLRLFRSKTRINLGDWDASPQLKLFTQIYSISRVPSGNTFQQNFATCFHFSWI